MTTKKAKSMNETSYGTEMLLEADDWANTGRPEYAKMLTEDQMKREKERQKASTKQKNEPKPDLLAETDDGLPEKYEPLVSALVEELRRERPDLFE